MIFKSKVLLTSEGYKTRGSIGSNILAKGIPSLIAWEEERWEKVGKLSNSKKGSEYKVCDLDFDEAPGGWKLVAVYFTALEKSEECLWPGRVT